MIKCKHCGKELNESNFYRLGDGYRQPCKQCRINIAKEKYANITEKKCGKCGKVKPVSEFDFSRDYGYQSYCRECKKENYHKQPKYEPKQEGKRICSVCKKEKNITDFSISKQNKEGRETICRDCKSKYDAARIFPVKQEGTKYCPRCKQELPIIEFSIARGNPDGRFYCCKKCAVKFSNEIIKKRCEICGKEFQGKREKDKYCPDCKKMHNSHTEPEWELINILDKYDIKYICEYGLENRFWFDFYLPDYNLLVDINPTYSHAAIKTYYPAKRKYYHWDRMKLASKNNLKSICMWDWDNKEAIVEAIKNNTLKIEKHEIQKHWNICGETSKHVLDNNFDEQEMIAEGWVPLYDDGITLIY